MKDMFLSCPEASKARRTFMNPSDTVSILRIGLLLVFCHPSPMKWGQDPHVLLLQTIIGRRKNFGCPSGPSGQNSIFPMCVGERDDGISTLHSHQYRLEELLDQYVRHCVVGLLACTRSGDVGVYLDNFTFPLTLCHTSFEWHTDCLLFVLLLHGVSIVNFLSHREESGLQCNICLDLHVANLRYTFKEQGSLEPTDVDSLQGRLSFTLSSSYVNVGRVVIQPLIDRDTGNSSKGDSWSWTKSMSHMMRFYETLFPNLSPLIFDFLKRKHRKVDSTFLKHARHPWR